MSALADRLALADCHARYADLITRRAFGELAELFRPDCGLDLDLGDRTLTHVGPEAVGNFIGRAMQRFEFFTFAVLNAVYEIDSDAGVAAARLHMQELRMQDGRRTDAFGIYHDQFRRDPDGRWWFVHRRYGSFSRTAEPGAATDQVVFPVPDLDLAALVAEVRETG